VDFGGGVGGDSVVSVRRWFGGKVEWSMFDACFTFRCQDFE
jgi:hypothetical protein